MPFKHGAFAQLFRADLATENALRSYRSHNNANPVFLLSDGGDNLQGFAKEFGCAYIYEPVNNGTARQRLPRTNQYIWLRRIRDACSGYLSDVDWVLLLEPDVECLRAPTRAPAYALGGPSPGPAWTQDVRRLFVQIFGNLDGRPHLGHYYTGCGGSMFNRQVFLDCFERTSYEVFQCASCSDTRILKAEDATLSFLFQINGYETGGWSEFARWRKGGNPNAAFVHGNKTEYGKPTSYKLF